MSIGISAALGAEVERLRAENEALRKDAERCRRLDRALRAIGTLAKEAARRRCTISPQSVSEIFDSAMAGGA